MKKYFKKLFGIIRTCKFCGKKYHKNDRSWREGKLKINWYYDGRDKLAMSSHYPMIECCKECNKKWKQEKYKWFKKEKIR